MSARRGSKATAKTFSRRRSLKSPLVILNTSELVFVITDELFHGLLHKPKSFCYFEQNTLIAAGGVVKVVLCLKITVSTVVFFLSF